MRVARYRYLARSACAGGPAREVRSRRSALRGRAVNEIGMRVGVGLHRGQRKFGIADDFFFPGAQLAAEIFTLPVIHERLVVGRAIAADQARSASLPCKRCGVLDIALPLSEESSDWAAYSALGMTKQSRITKKSRKPCVHQCRVICVPIC